MQIGEGQLITQEFYNNSDHSKYVPVVLSTQDKAYIPIWLQSQTHYDLSRGDAYEHLYRRITSQPAITAGPLGQPWRLPAGPRQPGQTLRAPVVLRYEDGPAVVHAKLVQAHYLAPAQRVVGLALGETELRPPGWKEAGLSAPTLIVVTDDSIIWWFLSNPDQLVPQPAWQLRFADIEKVDVRKIPIDPYRPKMRVTHRLPARPSTILSWLIRPPEMADSIAKYFKSVTGH